MDKKEARTKIIVVLGPTAVGKSDLAVKLAKMTDGEVISADSRQVYKGLNIGTGKVTKAEMEGIPHYLLDIENPKNKFNVTDFATLGENAIKFISNKKGKNGQKIPIICGGTGFYIDSLVNGTIFSEVKEDPKLRAQLDKKTDSQLIAMLQKLDPIRAKNIDSKNRRKVIRAIEIAKTLGHVPKLENAPQKYVPLFIGLNIDRALLRERIMQRLIKRLDNGMLEEVENLHKNGLSWKRMEELGLEYRFISRYLQGKMTKPEMIERLHIEICQYAKRQMTWFKRNKDIKWFEPKEIKEIEKVVKSFLSKN